MASAIVRSSLRTALRGGARVNPSSTRSFSSGASVEEEAREAAKWEKITYDETAGISMKGVKISGRPLYLDMQATSPVDPRVLDAMLPYFVSRYGNPHSRTHLYGWESDEAVEVA